MFWSQFSWESTFSFFGSMFKLIKVIFVLQLKLTTTWRISSSFDCFHFRCMNWWRIVRWVTMRMRRKNLFGFISVLPFINVFSFIIIFSCISYFEFLFIMNIMWINKDVNAMRVSTSLTLSYTTTEFFYSIYWSHTSPTS